MGGSTGPPCPPTPMLPTRGNKKTQTLPTANENILCHVASQTAGIVHLNARPRTCANDQLFTKSCKRHDPRWRCGSTTTTHTRARTHTHAHKQYSIQHTAHSRFNLHTNNPPRTTHIPLQLFQSKGSLYDPVSPKLHRHKWRFGATLTSYRNY